MHTAAIGFPVLLRSLEQYAPMVKTMDLSRNVAIDEEPMLKVRFASNIKKGVGVFLCADNSNIPRGPGD